MRSRIFDIKLIVLFVLFLLGNTNIAAQYENVKKGDVIEINGIKAIVFQLDGYGHGTAMSIKALRGKKNVWCPDKKVLQFLNMESTTDGQANTKAIFEYCDAHRIPLSQFPAFDWCKRLGDGWYIPAEEQLKQFINFWLGNEQEFNWDDDDDETGLDLNASSPKEINERIMNEGGTPFFTGVYTSTLNSEKKVIVYDYNENKGTWRFKKVNPTSIKMYMSGRACYDF